MDIKFARDPSDESEIKAPPASTPPVSPSDKPEKSRKILIPIIAASVIVLAVLISGFFLLRAFSSGRDTDKTAAPSDSPAASPTVSPTPSNSTSQNSDPFFGAAGRSMVTDGLTDVKNNCDAKLVALTFDDGPSEASEAFIQELDELGVKCTFFMQGYRIETYPEAVQAMVESGHQIASHSYNHPNLTTLKAAEIAKQISDTDALLSEIDGKQNHYLRCPYGESNDTVNAAAQSPIIHWSVDSLDWQTRDTEAVYNEIISNAYDGSIILAHEIYETSRQGCIKAIKELQRQGYEFVTVEALLKRRGVEIVNGETYYNAQNKGINLPADDVELYFSGKSDQPRKKPHKKS